ncbi:MAG TPA: helix-turn-helix domain-containing protein [Mycobacteriales bacterium]|nr:helix-turn-helix domain-containing protein [Mycobacteriales bacterium]
MTFVDSSKHSFGLSCWRGTPGRMAYAHRHDDIEVNYATDGPLVYLFGGATVHVPPGRTVIFWAAQPHQLVQCPPGPVDWLTVPLPDFLRWRLPGDFVAGLLQSPARVSGPQPAENATIGAFRRWCGDLTADSAYLHDTAVLEIEAFVRRLALEVAPQPGSAEPVQGETGTTTTSATATGRAARMVQFIAAHFADQIRVEDVARSVHLNPQYAMTLFRRVVGTTVGSYLTQCRVAEAQRVLITTEQPIMDIAAAVGFGSQSQFYECFKAACGSTPANYRRTHPGTVIDAPTD